MKKILGVGCAFLALVLLQLLAVIVFLFLEMDPLAKTMVLAVFLLLTGGCVLAGELILSSPRNSRDMTDRLLAIVYVVRKMISGILAMAVLNLVATLLSAFMTVGPLVMGLLAMAFVVTCVVSALALFRALRPEDGEAENEEPEDEEPEESGGQEP